MGKNMQKILKLSFLAIILVTGLFIVKTPFTQALTINGQPACPTANSCPLIIDKITVNGFTDDDTSYNARITPIPYGYLKPNQTITISWSDNAETDGYLYYDPNWKQIKYIVKYGCGDSIDLKNDDHLIADNIISVKYTSWTVPSNITSYKYCKIWVYGNKVEQSSQPTSGVSNTRPFETQVSTPQLPDLIPSLLQPKDSNGNIKYIFQAGETIYFNIKEKNQGNASAGYHLGKVERNSNVITEYLSLGPIDANSEKSYDFGSIVSYTCPNSSMGENNTFIFTVDSSNEISESNENNNSISTQVSCLAQLPRYTCNSNYQCVVDPNGAYTSLTGCQNICVAPAVRYSCNTSTYQCYQAVFGTYATYNDCVTACQPPVTRYSCNSNYQCVVDSYGAYTSLSTCQAGCVVPPVRYSCNTNTYQCYQATNGTYATYNDCVNACQPPLTRYTCNANYQCVVASNGEYSSYNNCLSGCVTPNQCIITNFTSNDYSIATGDNIILNWNTSNCNSCNAYASPSNSYWTGSQATYGSRTVYSLQNSSTFTLTCSNNTTSDTETLNVNIQSVTPTLSFWADDYTLSRGDSTYLRWTSSNTNYCVASNGWSGTKSTSNYETTAPNSQTTYTLTCYGNAGQITQSLTIYITSPTTTLSFTKLGRNLSNGERVYSKIIRVAQGDVIEFYLTVTAGSANDLSNVVITDNLPSVFSYQSGTTKVNNIAQADGITTTGLSLGTIPRGTSKTVTFQVLSNNPGTYFTYTNTAQVTASGISAISDNATITFSSVLGAATVATGAEDSLLISVILSIGLAVLVWYYIKFNPQGKLVFARIENKIRDLRLEYIRKQIKR